VFTAKLTGEGADGEARIFHLLVGDEADGARRVVRGSESALYEIPGERLEDFSRTVAAYRFKKLAEFVPSDARQLELGEAFLHGHVQRGARPAAHHAVGGDTFGLGVVGQEDAVAEHIVGGGLDVVREHRVATCEEGAGPAHRHQGQGGPGRGTELHQPAVAEVVQNTTRPSSTATPPRPTGRSSALWP